MYHSFRECLDMACSLDDVAGRYRPYHVPAFVTNLCSSEQHVSVHNGCPIGLNLEQRICVAITGFQILSVRTDIPRVRRKLHAATFPLSFRGKKTAIPLRCFHVTHLTNDGTFSVCKSCTRSGNSRLGCAQNECMQQNLQQAEILHQALQQSESFCIFGISTDQLRKLDVSARA